MRDFDPLVRPSKDEWGLQIAKAVALRGECTRRRVGAVIMNPITRQTWIGINGMAPGAKNCLQGACPRGRHYQSYPLKGWCACGKLWPCEDTVAPDSSYDSGAGECHAVHAELSAMLDAGRSNLNEHCTLYVSEKPCAGCQRIIATCLKRVVWPGGEMKF